MDIYLITDKNKRQHEFIYPDCVWVAGEDGWTSRLPQNSDRKLRLETCFGLVKGAVKGRRVGSSLVQEEEGKDEPTIH